MDRLSADGRRSIVFAFLSAGIQGLIFFLAAGRTDLFRGWVFIGLELCAAAAISTLLFFVNPEVLDARGKLRREGVKPWDKTLVRLYMLFGVRLMLLAAGLDAGRFGWTHVPEALLPAGIVLYLAAQTLSSWALAVNPFFEPYVRIQSDRRQGVVAAGPYRLVRHPGYLGGILYPFAAALIIGSWAALLPASVGIGVLVYRTRREDETLSAELEGYPEYRARVRSRLIPGLW